jgi:dihydroflavonol-4-reductase
MSMKVLITGATGLLGNNLLRQCLSQGIETEVLVRKQSDLRPFHDLLASTHHPLVIHQGDITDIDSIRRAAKGISHIIHAAGDVRIGWKGLEKQRRTNVQGTSNIARVAHENRQRLIHVSTVNTLGLTGDQSPATEQTPFGFRNVPSTYVVSKREADVEIERWLAQGLEAIIVHPGFMFGPYDWKLSSGKMMVGLKRSYPLLSPSGGCSLCDARDVASGIIAALERWNSGEHFILAGHNITYLQLWRTISAIIGGVRPLGRMGPIGMLAMSIYGNLANRFSRDERLINSAVLRMSAQYHYYSSEKASRLLGYQFREISTIIKDAWKWLKDNGMA